VKSPEAEGVGIPIFLAVIAPVVVVACIEVLHSAWWTFALYQMGICLVFPAIESRLKGRSWRDHAEMLGLVQGRDEFGKGSGDSVARSGTGVRHPMGVAVALGVGTAVATAAFLLLTRDRFLDPERLEATVSGWGVPPEQILLALGFMAVVNAPAEELFWRGYFPGRIARIHSHRRPPLWLAVFLPAFLYASYHVATISRLVGTLPGTLWMAGGVLGGGLLWGWLRWRTGSVWPALLSHSGGVLAYLAAHFWLTR